MIFQVIFNYCYHSAYACRNLGQEIGKSRQQLCIVDECSIGRGAFNKPRYLHSPPLLRAAVSVTCRVMDANSLPYSHQFQFYLPFNQGKLEFIGAGLLEQMVAPRLSKRQELAHGTAEAAVFSRSRSAS